MPTRIGSTPNSRFLSAGLQKDTSNQDTEASNDHAREARCDADNDVGENMNFNHPVIPLVARLLMSYVYLTSGLGKIFDWQGNVAYMDHHHLPMIPVLLATAAFVELAGSLCLISGYQARWAAFVMFGYTAVLTLLLHNYWVYIGDLAGVQETHFRKNLAIMGGLLMVSYGGPGRWAIGKNA
jgi:putative oxidoreductase